MLATAIFSYSLIARPNGHLVINTKPMATNQGCKGVVPGKWLDHKFLFYYLSSVVQLLNDLGTGATFKELSGGKLKEVPLPLPRSPSSAASSPFWTMRSRGWTSCAPTQRETFATRAISSSANLNRHLLKVAKVGNERHWR